MDRALVLTFDNRVDAASGPGFSLAHAFPPLGFQVICVSLFDAYYRLNRELLGELMNDLAIVDSDIVITMGAPAIQVTWEGKPLFECLGKRFFLWSLDSLIYDSVRVPGVAEFVEATKASSRFGMLSPDRDNRDTLNQLADDPVCTYFPFAGSYRPLTGVDRHPRVAVIGNLGAELAPVSSASFMSLVFAAPPSLAPREKLLEFANLIEQPGAPQNIISIARDFLGLSAEQIYSREVSEYLAQVDAYQKRHRRVIAVSQLRDFPVDFFGTGWEPVTQDFADCRYMGEIPYLAIGDVCQRYSTLLNFDTNWDYGLHPRVHTAIGSGCRVVTNTSGAIADLNLPADDAIFTYDGNDPAAIPDAVSTSLKLPALETDALHQFRLENSWLARLDNFLTDLHSR